MRINGKELKKYGVEVSDYIHEIKQKNSYGGLLPGHHHVQVERSQQSFVTAMNEIDDALFVHSEIGGS